MICQRCGACCVTTAVVIRVGDGAFRKPADVRCPHLRFEPGGNGGLTVAACDVHDEPWYGDTPCHRAGHPELDPTHAFARARACTLGSLVMASSGLREALRAAPPADLGPLEYLGPWPDPARPGR